MLTDLCCERCAKLSRNERQLADEAAVLWRQIRSLGWTATRISALAGKQLDETHSTPALRLEFFNADRLPAPLQLFRLDDPNEVKVLSGPPPELTIPLLRLNPSSWKPELLVTRRQLTLLWWTRHRRAKIDHRLDRTPRKKGDWEVILGGLELQKLIEKGWASLLSHQLAAEAIERYVEAQPKRTRGALGDEGKSPEQIHLQWMSRTSWMMHHVLTLGIATLLKQTPRPKHVRVNLNLRYIGRWDRDRSAACNHLVGAELLEKEKGYSNSWLLNTDPMQIPGIVALIGLDTRETEKPTAAPQPEKPLLKFS